MKRTGVCVLSLMVSLAISAQGIEILDSIRLEADPMVSRSVGRVELRTNHVVIEFSDDNTVKWSLQNPDHIFVGDKDWFGDRKATCNVKVGLYAADGTLLSIADKWKGIPSEHGTIMNMAAKGEMHNIKTEQDLELTIADLIVASKLRPGAYIRVVTPVYGDYLMDIKFRVPDRWYFKEGEFEKLIDQIDTKMKESAATN